MSQATSTSINQRHINGTVVGVNNGSIHFNITYDIQYVVNNIRFQPNFGLQSYMIEYIREKKIMKPFKSCHLLYYYVDKTVTGSSYRNLQQTLWQQAVPADGVQMHVFNNQDSEDSSILDQLVERLVAAQRDVYIIIDGLDQLPRRHSNELLRRLCNLSEKLKGENTHSGGHLAVAISSQNTPSFDRGKGYDKVFDLRLRPNYISSDIRKYLGNSSSDSTIFMGTTDLRRHSIQAQLDKETNNYPCLSSSIFYNPQGAATTQRLQTGISVLFYVFDVSVGLEDHGDVGGHVHDVYAHGCEGSIWTDASQRARRLEEALDFLQVRDEVDAGLELDDVPAGDQVGCGGLTGSGEIVFGHEMSGEDEPGRAPSWSLSSGGVAPWECSMQPRQAMRILVGVGENVESIEIRVKISLNAIETTKDLQQLIGSSRKELDEQR
ncbi:hypothetical protein V8C40DRAFT_261322 [Trichoderma camerunense]